MLDFTKTEKENIKFLFDHIQDNGSKNLSYLFKINFLKISICTLLALQNVLIG